MGGIAAKVTSSVLAPSQVGTYQITATVPDGVTPGDQVPVVVAAGNQQSQPVTMALR